MYRHIGLDSHIEPHIQLNCGEKSDELKGSLLLWFYLSLSLLLGFYLSLSLLLWFYLSLSLLLWFYLSLSLLLGFYLSLSLLLGFYLSFNSLKVYYHNIGLNSHMKAHLKIMNCKSHIPCISIMY